MQSGNHDACGRPDSCPDHPDLVDSLLARSHGDALIWISCATLAAGSALNLLLAGFLAG